MDSNEIANTGGSSHFQLAATATGAISFLSIFWYIQKYKSIAQWWTFTLPVTLVVACISWVYVVSAIVPEPYLDEVFHIPQAQKYCQGKFREWDDKITTPPGLYLFSVLVPGITSTEASLETFTCSAPSLRAVSALGLFVLAYLALRCRHELEARLFEAHSNVRLESYSQYALHTAVNIALFPLLFFFSGLYYTDVISTATVVAAYLNHLRRLGRDHSSPLSDLITIFLGILTLFMRQTNVFWVVVYMGGLETVHAIKTLRPERVEQPKIDTLGGMLKFFGWRYSLGDVHDPPLQEMWPEDVIFCGISLGIAAICNPLRVIKQIWPYVTVLFSFAAFVIWNGGVVLGDKSNHVATIHLAQMLYIWPFFAFFSLPLLLPYAMSLLDIAHRLFNVIVGVKPNQGSTPGSSTGSEDPKTNTKATPESREPSHGSVPASAFTPSIIMWVIANLGAVILSIAVVKFNTIIHPFTLADNRHYMFYIFRYTIRRSMLVRFALVMPYTLCRWMAWGTMAGCSDWLWFSRSQEYSAHHQSGRYPFQNSPFSTATIKQASADIQEAQPIPSSKEDTAQQQRVKEMLAKDPLLASTEPASASTGLIFVLTTALSLVTAPLVEPRYFIIPWVMWRLLVPAWRLHDHERPDGLVQGLSRSTCFRKVMTFSNQYDVRLFVETLWFIAINIATGYIFLTKPYQWRAEDGSLLDEGRLQRFMW